VIVVAGGGPAGAYAACRLAQAGRTVRLIERAVSPAHKICGEFISIEAQRHLAAIGFLPAAHGARTIARLRLVRGSQVIEAALPFCGVSLTRRALDEALLRHAASLGVEVLRGHAVRGIRGGGTPVVEVAGFGEIAADAVFLATGKHELRGQSRGSGGTQSDLIGFKTYFALAAGATEALAGHVEIILFPGGYAGLQLVEGGLANLCLLVDPACFAAAGRSWEGLLAFLLDCSPHLRQRLEDAQPRLARPLTIARVPYGFLHVPRRSAPEGVFRLGDQVGVIPSFSGDGIAIALHSAGVAVEMHLQGASAGAYHRRIRRDLGGQLALASRLQRLGRNRLGGALLFGACRVFPGLLTSLARRTRVRPAQEDSPLRRFADKVAG